MRNWMKFLVSLGFCMAIANSATLYAIEDTGPSVTMQSAATATGAGTSMQTRGYNAVAVYVTISGTSATVTFQGSQDGSSYDSLVCTGTNGPTSTSTATATGLYQCNVSGLGLFRTNITACSSCTVTTTGTPSTAVASVGSSRTTALMNSTGGVPSSAAKGGVCPPSSTSSPTTVQIAGGNSGASSVNRNCGNVIISVDRNNVGGSCIFCITDSRNQHTMVGFTADDMQFRINGIINIGPGLDSGYSTDYATASSTVLGSTLPSAIASMYVASPDIGNRSTQVSSTMILFGCETNVYASVCGSAAAMPDHIMAYAGDTLANTVADPIAAAPAFQVTDPGLLTHGGSKRVTTQFDKTDATLANVTGLSVNVKAPATTVQVSGAYHFRAYLYVAPAAAGGEKFAIAGTATATSIKYQVSCVNASTTAIIPLTSAYQTALAGAVGEHASGVTAMTCTIEGDLVVNAAGTLTVQFAQNTASGTSSVLTNSMFEVTGIF